MDSVPMASFLMGELSFVKADFDAAGKHFEKVLQKSPTDYQTIAKAIEAFRRAGKLEQSSKLLENAKQTDPKSDSSAGYNYCQGLCYWATGEHNLALRHLNRCRSDKTFAEDAVHLMADVYLTSECQLTYVETNNHSAHSLISSNAATPYSDTMHRHIAGDGFSDSKHDDNTGYETVSKLLKSLPVVKKEKRHQYLCILAPLLTGSKAKIETSLESFAQMAHDEPDSSAVVYGAAACYIALRQTQKARNQLKRLAKVPWTAQVSRLAGSPVPRYFIPLKCVFRGSVVVEATLSSAR
ncbi:unnamed protein product [Dicrocoelium dendriticum]|nr:unnamed protein product [Dicrocoelium dendriticum]